MRAHDTRWALMVVVGLAIGCEAKVERQAPKGAAASVQATDETQPKADAKTQAKPDAKTDAEAGPAGADDAAGPKDLGQRFRDPPWFRKTMLEGATALSTARSEADEQGLFKSHILFEMPEGTTAQQCVEQVIAKVSSTVSNLERSEQPDGRLKVEGSTDRYSVVAMCGEAGGKTRAYVGYEWTAP